MSLSEFSSETETVKIVSDCLKGLAKFGRSLMRSRVYKLRHICVSGVETLF